MWVNGRKGGGGLKISDQLKVDRMNPLVPDRPLVPDLFYPKFRRWSDFSRFLANYGAQIVVFPVVLEDIEFKKARSPNQFT